MACLTFGLGGLVAEMASDASDTDVSVEVSAGPSDVSEGFVDNIEDVKCADAGTEIEAACNMKSLSCSCGADVLFGHNDVIPLTGRATDTFDALTRPGIKCRSQANTLCDCWALCSGPPSD